MSKLHWMLLATPDALSRSLHVDIIGYNHVLGMPERRSLFAPRCEGRFSISADRVRIGERHEQVLSSFGPSFPCARFPVERWTANARILRSEWPQFGKRVSLLRRWVSL